MFKIGDRSTDIETDNESDSTIDEDFALKLSQYDTEMKYSERVVHRSKSKQKEDFQKNDSSRKSSYIFQHNERGSMADNVLTCRNFQPSWQQIVYSIQINYYTVHKIYYPEFLQSFHYLELLAETPQTVVTSQHHPPDLSQENRASYQ